MVLHSVIRNPRLNKTLFLLTAAGSLSDARRRVDLDGPQKGLGFPALFIVGAGILSPLVLVELLKPSLYG